MKKVLIAYYSWSDSANTQKLAEKIQKEIGGTLFEVKMKEPYTEAYTALTKRAKKEIQEEYLPTLANDINIDEYDTILIGSPNWWGTIAPVVLSFIRKHDFSGKRVIPFCTHGGGGEQHVFKDMITACKPKATEKGLCIAGNFINTSDKQIENWSNSLK